jgi:hypothetical protein
MASTRNAAPSATTSTLPGRRPSRSLSGFGITNLPALSMVALMHQDTKIEHATVELSRQAHGENRLSLSDTAAKHPANGSPTRPANPTGYYACRLIIASHARHWECSRLPGSRQTDFATARHGSSGFPAVFLCLCSPAPGQQEGQSELALPIGVLVSDFSPKAPGRPARQRKTHLGTTWQTPIRWYASMSIHNPCQFCHSPLATRMA